jgi:serine protease Do
MRRRSVHAVVAALTLGLGAAPSATAGEKAPTLAAIEREQTQLFSRIAPSVVFIAGPQGFGSGFFVSERGHVLTNRHVVEGLDSVRVVTHEGRRLAGKVVARGDDGLDLAIVKVAAEHTPALSLASSKEVPIGTWVGSVGHGRGGIWTLSTGLVSNLWGDTRKHGVLQTQIPLNPGASGGPVFDRRGAVIGIVTAGVADAQAINFAIRTDTAVQGMPYLRSLTDCLIVEAEPGASVQVDGHYVGKGPRLALLLPAGEHVVSTLAGGRRIKRTVELPRERTVDLRAD